MPVAIVDTRITTTIAGNSLLMRCNQNLTKWIVFSECHSRMRMPVIKYPESTKNKVTPKSPQGKIDGAM